MEEISGGVEQATSAHHSAVVFAGILPKQTYSQLPPTLIFIATQRQLIADPRHP